MPKFSEKSLMKLGTCHSDLQTLFNEVIKHFDCSVLEGHRGQKDQDAAFAAGNSKLKWPHGKHNSLPSLAVDVAPYPVNFSDSKRFYYFAGQVMGIAKTLKDQGKMKHDIRWGGNFDMDNDLSDGGLVDLPHYEIVR